ncbi:hypothetical protein [Edaphobacter sp.]|uniref:hypothetical protein n=1 Tax=Edaphobacter sp. TaxID=1934404 RepID=UPI002DBB010D|nr:hypothetical protein [Edaphobacter sp.]HEU5340159.1 hypothetical protein [Edaphobacter sp.]
MAFSGKKIASTSRDAFALLVPASSEAGADGEVISEPEVGTAWVRRFTDQDVKGAKKRLSKIELARFSRLVTAKDALEHPGSFPEALRRIMLHYGEVEYREKKANLSPEALQVGKNIAGVVGLSPVDSYMHLVGEAVGLRARQDAKRFFAREAAKAFALAMWVLWLENGCIRPAVYCLDEKTALYGHEFFFPSIGGCRYILCRGCEKVFFQNDPRDSYHSKQCGNKTRRAKSRNLRKDG